MDAVDELLDPAVVAGSLEGLRVPIDGLNLDGANARKHGKRNLEAIKASLVRFGQRVPVVVQREGMVVRAGNGRVAAARELGWRTVAAVVVDEPSVEATAFALADNRTAELAEWDDDALRDALRALEEDGAGIVGWTDAEVERALREDADQDEVPEPSAEPVTRPGDLWILGRHRVLCGDATSEEDVERTLGGDVPFLMVTDPPYGVGYRPEWRNEAAAEGKLAFAAKRTGAVRNDDRADWGEAYALFPGDVAYTWTSAGDRCIVSGLALQGVGFEIRCGIVWVKPHFPISRGHYTYQHEAAWYAVRKGGKARWVGDASSSSVWKVALDRNVEGGHGTQKPVELMARPMRNHDAAEVYDPFLGSGTTLVAAEQLGRTCYGIEIAPAYVDVAVKRWEALTGGKAKLLKI